MKSNENIPTQNVDALLAQEDAIRMGRPVPEIEDKKEEMQQDKKEETPTEELPLAAEGAPKELNEQQPDEEDGASPEIDEYGNKVGKKKLYTQEEVSEMIRERFNRGRWKEQNPPPANENQQTNPTSKKDEEEESWEAQLENFIDTRLERKEKEAQAKEWQRREEDAQAKFELKFSNGMAKYNDFSNVVKGKPITSHMMMATRSFNDPASFIYAACKLHPKEVERIAQIDDPITQIAEVGRLEEKMRKAKAAASSHKPVAKHAGDVGTDINARPNIDQLIISHAKSKLRR